MQNKLLKLRHFSYFTEAEVEEEVATKFKTREHAGTAERDKLFDKLFTNYHKDNYPENTTVSVGVSLMDVSFVREPNKLKFLLMTNF